MADLSKLKNQKYAYLNQLSTETGRAVKDGSLIGMR